MERQLETEALVLFNRDYKEKDKLVKLFTEKKGKKMFYIRHVHRKNNPFLAAIQPYTLANYVVDVNEDGLSFMKDIKSIEPYHTIQKDIFISAYATYILNLVDVAINDGEIDLALYGFTKEALHFLNQGIDAEVVTNIFEIQILKRFGFSFDWSQCAVCGETQGKFDFSAQRSGILCEKHWSLDPHRYHFDPVAVHFLRVFSSISYEQIKSISLKTETKQELRMIIDQLYEEYVGIHLKSKKFIDQMKNWQDVLKN